MGESRGHRRRDNSDTNHSSRWTGHPSPVPVWCDDHWCGVVWCGVVWCSVVWYHGVVWCGVVWCGVVWYHGVVWCGVVWCGVVWCGVVWCGVVRCATLCCGTNCPRYTRRSTLNSCRPDRKVDWTLLHRHAQPVDGKQIIRRLLWKCSLNSPNIPPFFFSRGWGRRKGRLFCKVD